MANNHIIGVERYPLNVQMPVELLRRLDGHLQPGESRLAAIYRAVEELVDRRERRKPRARGSRRGER